MRTVNVELPDGRHYRVHVGPGVRHDLAAIVAAAVPMARRAAIVSQDGPLAALGELDPGIEHRMFPIGDGEEHKNLATIEQLCRSWAEWGMNRNDVVIAVGGGLVTDVGGFAASCYHRGIAVVYISTTLLGMIDAAIGGKTGVNLPEGKNLVGAYWQPSAVLCDTDALAGMAPREYRSGLGEMAKYHFLDPLPGEPRPVGLPAFDSLPLEDRIAKCIDIKARVVGADEREGGLRAILNYGHTLAHALEIASAFDIRHGEAVAVGLLYAAELGRRLGRIDEARVAEHRRIVAAYDLPMTLPPGTDTDQLITLMGRDKKALDGFTFVLDGPNGVETVTGIDRNILEEAMDALR